jgi:ABC-2 type transport system ATP-binding protein
MTDAISVRGLVKTFGSVRALDGLDLSVQAGEVHGFLGPNRAGKTTTIRILLGLMRAQAGIVRLLGGDPWSDTAALHRRLAYVPGDVTLWSNLSGGEATCDPRSIQYSQLMRVAAFSSAGSLSRLSIRCSLAVACSSLA